MNFDSYMKCADYRIGRAPIAITNYEKTIEFFHTTKFRAMTIGT